MSLTDDLSRPVPAAAPAARSAVDRLVHPRSIVVVGGSTGGGGDAERQTSVAPTVVRRSGVGARSRCRLRIRGGRHATGGRFGGRRVGMHAGDRGLQRVGAEALRAERLLDERRPFGDQRLIPARAILILAENQVAIG